MIKMRISEPISFGFRNVRIARCGLWLKGEGMPDKELGDEDDKAKLNLRSRIDDLPRPFDFP